MKKMTSLQDLRTLRLNNLMKEHKLSVQDIMDITGRARNTVMMWRLGRPNAVPEHTLKLLELQIKG